MPDIEDALPYFSKRLGTKLTSIRLIPCIHPVMTVDKITDTAALYNEKKNKSADANAPIPNIQVEQASSLVNTLPYSHDTICKDIILKIGRPTPVRIDISLLRL